jgi:hypothetical protein
MRHVSPIVWPHRFFPQQQLSIQPWYLGFRPSSFFPMLAILVVLQLNSLSMLTTLPFPHMKVLHTAAASKSFGGSSPHGK